MVKKKKENVPTVEAQSITEKAKPEKPDLSEVPVEKQEVPPPAPTEKPIVVSAPLKNILTKLNSLKPEEQAILNQFGALPLLEDFAIWMFMVEKTLGKVGNITEKGVAEELFKKAQEQRTPQQNQTSALTGNQGGGINLGTILELLKQYGGIGGGDAFSQAIQQEMMSTAIENMRLGNAMLRGMVTKTFPEMATDVLKKKEGA